MRRLLTTRWSALARRHHRAAARWLARRSARRVGLVLVYHRVGEPAGDPRNELVPALSARLFVAQLDHLRSAHRMVPPSCLLESARARPRERALRAVESAGTRLALGGDARAVHEVAAVIERLPPDPRDARRR